MPKIQRKTQKVFCNSADSDQLAVFGSMSTGTPVYSSDVEELQSNEAFDLGWDAATLEDKAPFMEEMNGVQYGLTYQIAYGLQEGIPEYDSATTYYIGSICKVLEDGKPILYTSLTDDNIGNNPVNDSTNWERLSFGGGGLEIGDIGFTQMAIDETKGKRRVLNGQLIIQEQYPQFTQIVKNSVALNADLVCTEDEWQTAVTMSANGVCYKYVIDDVAGTIRLPKYPEYLDLSINGAKTVSVYGTGKTLGLSDGNKIASIIWGSGSYVGHQMGSYDGANKNIGSVVGGNWTTGSNYTAIGVTTNASKSGLTGKVTTSSEQIKGTYFIQVATGAETEDNIINEIELNNPFFLGMSQYFETAPNNSSWLKSEGQWNSKAVYPTVYDWALINANNSIEGFKLVTDTYTDYDYVINTADETFRLPLLNGSEDLLSDRYEDLTLPESNSSIFAPANGWYMLYQTSTAADQRVWLQVQKNNTIVYDSSVYSSAANNSLRCQVPVTRGDEFSPVYTAPTKGRFRFIYAQGNGSLYFYVGETVQNANLVNIGRIQEHYTTKSMVDGQWVNQSISLCSNSNVSSTVTTYDISNYLPNDGYVYEVIGNLFLTTGTASGNTVKIKMSTDIMNSHWVAGTQTRSASAVISVAQIVMIVGNGRKINIQSDSADVGKYSLQLTTYRRIGTNL